MVNYDYAKRVKKLDTINSISFVPAKLRDILTKTNAPAVPNNAFVSETNQDFISEDGNFFVSEQ
jgi:hypothetical protein